MHPNNTNNYWLKKAVGFTVLSAILSLSHAQTATITTTNGSTREVKNYSVGNQHFEIPVSNIAGWSKCTVSGLKEFEYEGMRRARVDMYCYTQQGQMAHYYCTAGKGSLEVTIAQIMATGSRYNAKSNELNVTGNLEMVMSCSYLR